MAEDEEFTHIEYFQNPKEPAQKRYEALRAYFLESLTQKEAAKRAGYSISTFQSLISNFQNGKVEFFVKPQYVPNRRQASDFIHERIVSLRKSGHSVYEIKDIISKEGFSTSIQTINRIIKDEGFSKLPRRTRENLASQKRTRFCHQCLQQLISINLRTTSSIARWVNILLPTVYSTNRIV